MTDQPDTTDHGREMPPDEALSSYASALRDSSVWATQPDGLGERVVAAIQAERAARPLRNTSPTVEALPATVTALRAPQMNRERPRWLRTALPAAAVAALAFGAGALLTREDSSPALDDPADAAASVVMTGTELAPSAAASGLIFDRGAGYSIRLDMEGLAPAPAGEYYEGWVQSAGGDVVSVGTFHMRGGDGAVVLWSGVSVEDYSTLLVTRQAEGEPTDVVVSNVVLSGPML